MNNNQDYPPINNLLRHSSDQTVALSLRIKDSTRSLFDLEAQKSGSTISALVNNLLDDYAEQYIARSLNQREINQQTLRRYIETIARKAGTLDTENLLRDTIVEYRPDALFENFDTDEEKLIRDFAMWAKNLPTHYFNQEAPHAYFPHSVITAVPPEKSARVEVDRFLSPSELDEYDIKCPTIDVYLPAPKWLIAITILSAFSTKIQQLLNQPLVVGETALRSIAYLANTANDNLQFAKCVAQILLQENLPTAKPEPTSTINLEDVKFATKGKPSISDKLTWADIAVAALEELGGSAKTTTIYQTCRNIATTLGKPITHKNRNSFNMSIQGTLETCSKDCNPNTKRDYFHITEKGSGIWHLNPGVHFDKKTQRTIVS